jgi:hypothetical protein
MLVEFDRRADIKVTQAVTVGEAESFFILYVIADALEPTASHRIVTRINERHAPGLCLLLMYDHIVICHFDSDVRHM